MPRPPGPPRRPQPGELDELRAVNDELARLKTNYLAERAKLRARRATVVAGLRAAPARWTVAHLAAALEVTRSAVSQWEHPPPEPDGDPGAGVH
jgi:DNA-binding transcriptional regulator YiaG